jgi:glutamate-1-semialdehyde 2,1-aminomutase
MIAGATTLELLTPTAIDRLNTQGAAFRRDLTTAFKDAGSPVQITGLGSLFAIHVAAHPVRSTRDTSKTYDALRHEIFLGLYNEGVLIDPRGVGNLSTVMGEEEMSRFGQALRAVLRRLDVSAFFRV